MSTFICRRGPFAIHGDDFPLELRSLRQPVRTEQSSVAAAIPSLENSGRSSNATFTSGIFVKIRHHHDAFQQAWPANAP
jgi:hypothetical protein